MEQIHSEKFQNYIEFFKKHRDIANIMKNYVDSLSEENETKKKNKKIMGVIDILYNFKCPTYKQNCEKIIKETKENNNKKAQQEDKEKINCQEYLF